jgi:hypothetical protein
LFGGQVVCKRESVKLGKSANGCPEVIIVEKK